MANEYAMPIPARRALRKLGSDLNEARRRRRLSMAMVAERADISRITLRKIERGDASVSMGGYAAVLCSLGLADALAEMADVSVDIVGQDLESDRLPKRIRLPQQAGAHP